MNNQKGFSLLEILIAISLGALILGVVGSNVMQMFSEGKQGVAVLQIKNFETPLNEFKRHCNRYPTEEQGLDALVEKPGGLKCRKYRSGGYMKEVPMDPWDEKYIYKSSDGGRTYEIISYGGDGVEGGDGEDSDISSEDSES